jgi:hypothetical protein
MSEQSETCTELSRNEECGIGDEMILDLGLPNSENVRQEWLKGYLTGVIVEANLKLVEHSRAAEKVETNSKTLRKTNGSSDLTGPS